MKEYILTALRIGGSALLGYVAIVIGTILTFEVFLGGIGYYKSSAGVLALASLGAVVSGLLGGYLAAWIGGSRPVQYALGVLVFLVLDTTFFVMSGKSVDPIWFNLADGATLMAATVLGGFLRRKVLVHGRRDLVPNTP